METIILHFITVDELKDKLRSIIREELKVAYNKTCKAFLKHHPCFGMFILRKKVYFFQTSVITSALVVSATGK